MFSFSKPNLIPLDDGRYELATSLVIESGLINFVVPVGYRTDLASIPRCLWSLLPPNGTYTVPAIAHDYLLDDGRGNRRCTRRIADAIFAQLMRDAGVPIKTRITIYFGVRFYSIYKRAFLRNR